MNYSVRTNSAEKISAENARFMTKVYKWMTLGITITGLVAYQISNNPNIIYSIIQNKMLFWMLIIAQFGVVFYLSAKVMKIKASTATLLYLVYSTLTGVTLSTIFLVYTQSSIQSAFFTTAFSFAGLTLFGYVIKKDLGPVGSFCTMGLFGLIGFALLSFIFPSIMGSVSSKVYGLVGIVVFAGLTAYDTQKIKMMNIIGNEGTEEKQKEAIRGALTLYLDFINLFLFILRFMGGRRN